MPLPGPRMNRAEVSANLEKMKHCNPGTHWEDINQPRLEKDTYYFQKQYHGLRSNRERIKFWYFWRDWLALAWRQKQDVQARLEEYKHELETLRRTPGTPPEKIENTKLNIRRAETRAHEAGMTYDEWKYQFQAYCGFVT